MIGPSTSTLLASLASVIAVSQAAILSPGFTPNVIDRRGLFDGPGALLQARQDNTQPNVPPECLPTCGPVNTLIQQSCPPTSCCTATFVQNYVTCLECVGPAAGLTDYSQGQASLHTLVEACNARGLPVIEVFLPGQSPSSTTTTSGETTVITSQSTIRSLTEPITPTNTISQNTVRNTESSPTATSPPSTSTSGTATGANSGAMGLGAGTRMAWATASGWVLPLVAAGMGVVLF